MNMQIEMKSTRFPSSMRHLTRTLPLTTFAGSSGAWVSGRKLHRLLRVTEDVDAWAAFWAREWHAWVEWRMEVDIGEPVREDARGECLIYAVLAQTMARNMVTCGADPRSATDVTAYLHHAERRWRIRNGGLLTAREVAEEYDLMDRRTNATRRIGDAIIDFAVRHVGMPPIGQISARRGFPAALVRAWHESGGGAELIEAERCRPKRAPLAVFKRENLTQEEREHLAERNRQMFVEMKAEFAARERATP